MNLLSGAIVGLAALGVLAPLAFVLRHKDPSPAEPAEDLWPVEGRSVDTAAFADMKVDQVLYELDQPLLFTSRLCDQLVLAYWCDVSSTVNAERWLVSTTTEDVVRGLKDNRIAVREALAQGVLFVLERTGGGRPLYAWKVSGIDAIPENNTPRPGTLLRAESEFMRECAEVAGVPTRPSLLE